MATVAIKYVDENNKVVEAQARSLQITMGTDIYSVQFKGNKAIIYLVSMFDYLTVSPGAFNMVALGAQKVE